MTSSKTTKGGLSPATLTNLSDNTIVHFHFNPYEYSISKNNSWSDLNVTGLNYPMVTFQHGGALTLSLKLYFDSQALDGDVRYFTQPLWDMMMIVESEENTLTGKSQPPSVEFKWGPLLFTAIVTSLTEKLTLFNANGVPLRSEIDISLQQYVSMSELNQQQQQAVKTALKESQSTQKVEGQRLDNIGDMRDVAGNNNINDPLNVPNGTTLNA